MDVEFLNMIMTRARFLRLVWTIPRPRIAAQLGISEDALVTLCEEVRIPSPPVKMPPAALISNAFLRRRLPRRELGEAGQVTVRGGFSARQPAEYLAEVLEEPWEDLSAMTERFSKRLSRIHYSSNPFRLHPLIASAIDTARIRHRTDSANRNPEAASERQRWGILNEIFLYVEAAGGRCWIDDKGLSAHSVRIGDTMLAITLDAPTTSMRLEVRSPAAPGETILACEDRPGRSLESHIKELVLEMAVAAETIIRRERDKLLHRLPRLVVAGITPHYVETSNLDRSASEIMISNSQS